MMGLTPCKQPRAVEIKQRHECLDKMVPSIRLSVYKAAQHPYHDGFVVFYSLLFQHFLGGMSKVKRSFPKCSNV